MIAREAVLVRRAVRKADLSTLNLLLESYPEQVDAPGQTGETPLHYAAYMGNSLTVGLLIAKGADVNAETRDGLSPLHFAAPFGRKQIAASLIANGDLISILPRPTL